MSTTKMESLPETSMLHQHSQAYELRAYIGPEFRFHAPVLRPIAADISRKAFHIENPQDAFKEVGGNLASGASIIIATLRETGEAVAYSTQKILRPPFEPSVAVMYTSTRAVLEAHRRSGLGTALFTYANTLHRAPDILCGSTANPEIVDLYEDSGIIHSELFYPRYRLYSESARMRKVVEYVIEQTKGSVQIDIDPETGLFTGLIKAVYKDGYDVYDNSAARTKTQDTYAWMQSLGYKQENGDAIVIAGVKKGRTNFIDRVIQRTIPSDDTV